MDRDGKRAVVRLFGRFLFAGVFSNASSLLCLSSEEDEGGGRSEALLVCWQRRSEDGRSANEETFTNSSHVNF